MDKKVLKALYQNICAKDEIRIVMNGVNFEESRCSATNGKLLVIVNESDARFAGKIVGPNGGFIEGRYPNVDAVFPSKEGKVAKIDLRQLQRACQWWCKRVEHNTSDTVVINGVGLNVGSINSLLNTFAVIGDLDDVTIQTHDETRAILFTCEKAKAVMMPSYFDYADVDVKNEFQGAHVFSYENFIYVYASTSWKPVEKKDAFSWMD